MAPRRSRSRALLTTLALSTLTLAACEYDPAFDPGADPAAEGDAGVDALPPAPAPVAEATHEIHGAAAFDGCTLAERNALNAALDFAQDRVSSGEFRDCLGDAFGVEADGRMVEELIADMNTLRGVDFRCVDGDDGANAGHDTVGNESMNIVGDLALNTDTAGLGAIIAHEVSHNHAWWHNHFYGPTWPDQVQSCVYRGQPFGARRSDLAGARLLAPAGGEGGTYRRLRCGEEEAMVGIRGALTADGRLARLQPLCQDIDGSVRAGNPWTWGMTVPAGGAVFEDRCAADKALIGLEGSAGRFVERVRAVCANIGGLRAYSGAVAKQTLPYHGRIQDWGYSRRCPERTIATGMRVRSGDLVDGFQLECDDFPLHDRGLGIALSGHGGWGGSYSQLECPGTMGLVGVYGQRDMNSSDLATIGGRCRPMSDDGVTEGDEWGWALAFTERAGRTQPTEDDNFLRTSYCDPDEALVGLAIAADDIVGDVGAVCADLDTWMAGDNTTRQATGVRIRPGETIDHVTCPTGQIAIALEARTGWLVDRIDLRCKAPDVAGKLRRLAGFGGNGGAAYDELCPDGRPMIGLRSEVYDGGLRWLNGRCGRHTDEGTSPVAPIDLPTVKGDEHPDNIDDCPLGKVMVGVEVAHGNGLASWAHAICADESSVRAGGAAQGLYYTPWRGGGGTWTAITASLCADGEVVRGLHGRRGALQDQIGVTCGKVPVLPGSTAVGSAGITGGTLHMLTIPEGFSGDLRLRLSGTRFLHPTVRVRRGAVPTANNNDASANGANGILWLDLEDPEPGRYYVEVTINAGVGGSYDLHFDPI